MADTLLLPTTVVGSYSVPEWLARLKTDFYRHRISSAHLAEVHDVAIKAAIKDQERAGIDVVSDGELRRDNDLDYLLAKIPGVRVADTIKSYYYDYYDIEVAEPLQTGGATTLGLVDDFLFTRSQTDHAIKFSLTGPFSLARRVRNTAYADDPALVRALAGVLNREARALAAAGAKVLQIDEPFLAGYPDGVDLAVEAINIVTEGVDAEWALHVCYGNRFARPSWEGHYDFLFPAVLEANVQSLVLEFARKGYDDLALFTRYPWGRKLGLGVIDVKSQDVESAAKVTARIHRALAVLGPDRLTVNPDCGLRHLPAAVARKKLKAMVAGAAIARHDVTGEQHETPEELGPDELGLEVTASADEKESACT